MNLTAVPQCFFSTTITHWPISRSGNIVSENCFVHRLYKECRNIPNIKHNGTVTHTP